jgi:hypothetical protein
METPGILKNEGSWYFKKMEAPGNQKIAPNPQIIPNIPSNLITKRNHQPNQKFPINKFPYQNPFIEFNFQTQ